MIVEYLEEFSASHVVGVQRVETVDFINNTATWHADTTNGPETLLNDSFASATVINWRFGFPTENGVISRDFSSPEGHEISTMMFQTSDGVWHDFYTEIDTDNLKYPPPLGGIPFRVFMDEDNHIQLFDQGNGAFATRILIDRQNAPTHGQEYITDDFLGFVGEFITCYLPGSLVTTATGVCAVENLRKGDLIWTSDAGYQPVKSLTRRKIQNPIGKDLPVQIRAGALGENTPNRDLAVSRQHRILIRSEIARRMFGAAEVFVSAKDLLPIEGIDTLSDLVEVSYIHVLLEHHHIIEVNGCLSESLLKGDMMTRCVSPAPEPDIPARLIPKTSQSRRLIDRHIKNRKPLFQKLPGQLSLEQPNTVARHIL